MDAIGLTVLLKEVEADCAVIQDAAHRAQVRLGESTDGHLERVDVTRRYPCTS
jgi:hypothetical protein